ncbi:uncharacterized protein LOC143019665 [Oratosquilla oratoria]|uniref:uncharacterized protein LOC143019665 n=1 Tax=Oratosquilla oratoria TaxID=337810 RepID=UPI003F77504E
MTAEKRICCGIMLCQMTAILSAVALLYLAVIVVIPSKKELEMDFNDIPVMCTTTKAKDILAQGNKLACNWTTCGEWCLSKASGICMQIDVMVRNNGSRVNFRNCVDISDQPCSALDVNVTHSMKCKKGGCKELTGTFYCTRDDDNECKDISPAYVCGGEINLINTIVCNEEKCEDPLHGVYACQNGKCNKYSSIKTYKDCQRLCSDWKMQDRNVVIFSQERLVTTTCTEVDSPDNNTISAVNASDEWRNKNEVLFIFCTYLSKDKSQRYYDIFAHDCFNASMSRRIDVENLTEFRTLLSHHVQFGGTPEWNILPESSLRIMNNTHLRINSEGCVNTLRKECKAFFLDHAHDGSDGITPDRFPCYYTDSCSDFVIAKYNPSMTRLYLMLTATLPSCLFVVACFCLFACSKSVGVDDDGHLRVTLLQGGGAGATKEPVVFDQLL